MELGGFAETRADIDGTEEEFDAFNYCLAEDYLTAMINEDFEEIGEIGIDTLENVMEWLNYDGEIGKDKEDIIKSIPRGEIITYKNRTLAEAAIEAEHLPCAEVFIYNGNLDPRLFMIVMEKSNNIGNEQETAILNLGLASADSAEEYIAFLKSIFDLIEERYNKKATLEEKKKYLEKIRPYIDRIRIKKDLNNLESVKTYIKNMNYNWHRDMAK